MKKGLTLTLQDAELIELCRVLIDKDAEGALILAGASQRQGARLVGGRVTRDDRGAWCRHHAGEREHFQAGVRAVAWLERLA